MQRTSTSMLAALATVAALTLTAMASPARAASNDDISRFVAGAITLYILGQVVEGNVNTSHRPQPKALANPFDRSRDHYGYRARMIPEVCVFDIRSHGRTRQVVGRDCLTQTVGLRRNLPNQCMEEIRLRRDRKIDVYDMRCLGRFGYQVADRRRR